MIDAYHLTPTEIAAYEDGSWADAPQEDEA